MALLATLTDDFGDNSRDAAKWSLDTLDLPGDAAITVSESSQTLRISPLVSASGAHYYGYVSVNTYDLTASAAYVHLKQSADSSGTAQTLFYVGRDYDDNLRFIVADLTLYCQKEVAGVRSTIFSATYSASTHAWWKISESGGTITFATATDNSGTPNSFTSRGTTTLSWVYTAVYASLEAGTWDPMAVPGTAIFDGFNTNDAAAVVTPFPPYPRRMIRLRA